MADSRQLGFDAENRAAEHLRNLGCTIITRNAHSRRGEIDIVAIDGDLLVFVEVKLRKKGAPEEAITPSKAERWRRSAIDYLRSVGEEDRPFRFDLIAVDSSGLRHHRDVLNG